MIGPAIVQLLAAAPVAALIGDRVYPVRLPPEPVLPAVAYQVIGEDRAKAPRSRPGLVKSMVQLSVIGADYDEAHAVAAAIRAAIDRQRGTFASIDVRDVLDAGSHDDPGDDSPQLVAMTWHIHWKEAP
ncbi:MAG TPA: DUF3168 domain-containing protein [Azonexus sp.]|nr:DUF3168 domain-containing protein [Azonexus sp.]